MNVMNEWMNVNERTNKWVNEFKDEYINENEL